MFRNDRIKRVKIQFRYISYKHIKNALKSSDFDIFPQFYDISNCKIYHQYKNHFQGWGVIPPTLNIHLRYKTYQLQKILSCKGSLWDAKRANYKVEDTCNRHI